MTPLTVLAVDDEPHALEDLAELLADLPEIDEVRTASEASEALAQMAREHFDAVFLDVRMPGMSGTELARVLQRFADPPALVFVTAHEDAAIEAFDLSAIDYVLKPVSAARLRQTVDRIVAARGGAPPEDRR
ncbi:MAG: hypothetical protein QOF58_4696, partial [Pseudonocardiales bacterium]|nr:hypothetical protein [Pseudonocardiales bacterium]